MSEAVASQERIKISGIRLSRAMTLVRFRGIENEPDPVGYLCRSLAANNISIYFLASAGGDIGLCIDCCVEYGRGDMVEATVLAGRNWGGNCEIVPDAGLLTIYPHRSIVAPIGCLTACLRAAKVTVLAMATSLSAVIAVLPYAEMDAAATAVAAGFDLPENATPLRDDFVVQPTGIDDGDSAA